jgi:large subunit ribosomal protein L10
MADRRPASEKPKGAAQPNRINRLLKAKYADDFKSLSNLIMLENKGLNNEETTALRVDANGRKYRYTIVRSRVTMKAFLEMGVEEAEKLFHGQTAIIEADDPVQAAKLALELVKKFDQKLVIIGGLLEGKVIDAKGVADLSKAPTKPELLSKLSGMLLAPARQMLAPVAGPGRQLAGAVQSVGGQVVGVVKTISEKGEAA